MDEQPRARRAAPSRGPSGLKTVIAGVVVLVGLGMVAGVGYLGLLLWNRVSAPPPAEGCLVRVADLTVSLTPEQAANAAIIAAEAQRRGLPERAVVVALATAYQESGIRNLSGGDRDSVGLFQQRPSQGWGSVEEIMDPWYASGKFYDALVRLKGWETMDVNDAAQKVQISAFPEAYRKHVANAEALAAALVGRTPAAMICVDRSSGESDPEAAQELLERSLTGRVLVTRAPSGLEISADSSADLWSAVHLAMATSARAGLTEADVEAKRWRMDAEAVTSWEDAPAGDESAVGTARLVFR